MRGGDSDEKFQPLGPKVQPPAPEPKPEWRPTGTPGIDINQQGQLRHVPTPPPAPLYYGTPETWGRAIESIRLGR